MAKLVPDAQLDAMLLVLITATDQLDVCEDTPVDYSTATTKDTYSLGPVAVTAGIGADWSAAAGDATGRKVTMAQQTGVTVDCTGSKDATHIAGTDGSAVLYFVTTCTSQSVTDGNTMTINTFDIEIADAV